MGGDSIFTGGCFSAGSLSDGGSSAAIRDETREDPRSGRDSILGRAPTRIEVERAVTTLRRFMHWLSISPPEDIHRLFRLDPNVLQSPGFLKFCDAFSTMQNEPALQNTVMSISSDKAVWEAVLNNAAVQNFQSSIPRDEDIKLLGCNQQPDILEFLLNIIMGFAKSKILLLVEMFVSLVHDIFRLYRRDGTTFVASNHLEEKARSSLLLSVVILLVVVASRIQSRG